MGPGRSSVLFKAAYRLTVFLALGVSTGCLSGGNPETSPGSGSAWTTKTPMPFPPRVGLAVGVVNGILYAVGGNNVCNGSNCVVKYLPTVQAYDPTTNTWTPMASMPTARSGLAVGVVNGILYAIGGTKDGVNNLGTVEAYDPVMNTWDTQKAAMPTARYGLGVGVVNGLLYAVGGASGPNPTTAVEVYDPGMDQWTPMAPMPTGRMLLGVGVVTNILYAVGGSTDGSNNLSTVEAYDPATNQWITKPPIRQMPTARGGLAVGVNDGILYAVGGQLPDIQPGDTVPKTLEAYNPITDTWKTMDPMPIGKTLLAADVVNGVLYAVGGDDQGTVETFTP